MFLCILNGADMACGQIHHVNVVPNPGAVVGGIVVAENTQFFAFANGYLGDERQQVVGDAVGIFPDQTAFVGADGVEVAKQHNAEIGVCCGGISQDLLDHVFCPAIGIGAACSHGFVNGNFIRYAVNRG